MPCKYPPVACVRRILLAVVLTFAPAAVSLAQDQLVLLPSQITLSNSQASQSVVAEQLRQGKMVGPADKATWKVENPKIAEWQDGRLVPLANGKTKLIAQAGELAAQAEVVVSGMELPFEWSFRNHVQAVLTKTGCNMGACHGAQAGKKGFKLSLRGYDAEGDYRTLTRQARGRRITQDDPARSLILTKPTGLLPHGGGMRFEVNSREFQIVSEWIASGLTPPKPEDRRISHLEILPKNAVLKPGQTQPLVVLAHFNDGHREDVTRWVKYDSAQLDVAQVDDLGRVTVVGYGEGAITVWYLSKVVVASVTVPFDNQVPPEVFAKAAKRNFIDELVLSKLQDLNLPPSDDCTDAEFLRRAYLDLLGILPTPDETRKFLADTSPKKRDALIDALLERPEFVDYWSYKWSDLLLVTSGRLKPAAMWSYYNWIRNNVAANTPWDEMARRVLTATGSTLENGAVNYFVLHKDPQDLTETTSQAFLGMSVNCARCHNHPLEKWTNDQYYGMANLFSRVRAKDVPGDGNQIVYCVDEGELIQPVTGRPQLPCPLDADPLTFDDPQDRRIKLAQWLTAAENPYFSRAIANRVWANFFGVGIVESVDDLRLTNPASNEQLMDKLSEYLVQEKFNLKSLMRHIMQSKTYQRSSVPQPGNVGDRRFYSRYFPKRLMAEVALDAVSQVTGDPTKFLGYPVGWRALQLPDSNVNSYFLNAFGRPERVITCECERTAEPSVVQAMHLTNGDTINNKLQAKSNRLGQLLSAKTKPDAIIEEAYLSSLSRFPTAAEKSALLAAFTAEPPDQHRAFLEDMYWSLLSSKEFLFNH